MNELSDFSVSVIMPTFNEVGHIQSLICETAQALIASGVQEYEIIVVDDDSPDHTWEKAAQVSCNNPVNVKVIRRVKDHGLTASIRDGIASAQSEVIVWMDCDFSHPPEKIPQMLYMLRQGYDIVVNSRYTIGGGEERVGKGGFLQLFLSRLLNWSVRFMLKPSFSDYTSGFIAVRRNVFDEIDLRGDYGEYFVDFIYRVIKLGYHICELPYIAMPRRSGESKTGNNIMQYLKRGWKYLWTVLQLRIHSRKYFKKNDKSALSVDARDSMSVS
jgi:dolichol-phosphate mannosyltransferase